MSEFKTASIENRSGGSPSFTQGLNVGGADVTSGRVLSEYYTGATEPSSPANGAFWWNGTNLHQYVNGKFRVLEAVAPIVNGGNRGVFGGGNGSSDNVIDYISIPTPGNATDFGDLSSNNYILGGCSNGSRGLFGGGYSNTGGSNTNTNTIEYITIATTGNVTDFGDLTQARRSLHALSNATRGVFVSGFVGETIGGSFVGDVGTMDYVTIATTGNAIDFGDLVNNGSAKGPAAADATRGVIRDNYSTSNAFSYITINTAGNATTFGNSTVAQETGGACADSSRALFAYYEGTIEYLTIQTLGNATDFGNLTDLNRSDLTGTGNASRGVFAGGQSTKNTIDYVTIQTVGNATDFGDLTIGRYGAAGLSGD
jgi:hypothetical protein